MMKKRKLKPSRLLILLLPIFIVFFLLKSCNKEETPAPTPSPTPEAYVDPVYKHDYDFKHFFWQENRLVYKDDKYHSEFGIDVSYLQTNINWLELKEAGVEFVMIRGGYRGYETGLLNTDKEFYEHIQMATAVKIPVGVYYLTQAITEEEAIEEAQYVLNLVKDYPLSMPIALDMELASDHDRMKDLTPTERTQNTLAFIKTIKEAGYTPAIYASASWFMHELYMEELQDDCEFWVANYHTEDCPYPYQFSMWQYSGKGHLPGISVQVDYNIRMIPN